MGRIPEKLIERIIESSDIVDIISEFVPLKKAGRNYMGVCPFHGDKGPSLSVSREKQLYHCFGCGASGNTVGFIMKIRNLEYIDAVKFLADKAHIEIEEEEDPRVSKINLIKKRIFEANLESGRFFFTNLKKSKIAINYFLNRGVDLNTIKKFGLGYSLDNYYALLNHLKGKGFDEEILMTSGLISKGTKSNYDRFRNRVMFPVFDIKGRITGFGGRVLDNSTPKYLNSPETPVFLKGTNLYGLNFAVRDNIPDYLIIVEGYMDLISLHQFGIKNSVASLGTSLTQEQARLLKRYVRDVYICYDADAAGKAATLRGLDILRENGLNVKIISIPKGKDPDEFLKEFGAEDFKKLIDDSLPVVDYRIKMAEEGKNLKNMEELSLFVNEAAKILGGLNNQIDIQAHVSKIYDRTGINPSAILEEINKVKKGDNKGEERVKETALSREPVYKKAERAVLSIILSSDVFREHILKNLSTEEYITPVLKTAAELIYEDFAKDKEVAPREFMMNFKNQRDIEEAASLFEEDLMPKDITDKIVEDLLNTIKKYNLERKIEELTVDIKEFEKNNEIENCTLLSQKKLELQKQLKTL